MPKHQKWTVRLPLSTGCFSISQAGVFLCYTTTVGLFWGIIILLWFYVPSCDFFFLQSFANFHFCEDGNFRAFKSRVKNAFFLHYSCQIVFRLRCLTYLAKMKLFPQTAFLPEGCENRIIQRRLYCVDERSISLFASFLEKENALETLILIFENVSPKGFFWQN